MPLDYLSIEPTGTFKTGSGFFGKHRFLVLLGYMLFFLLSLPVVQHLPFKDGSPWPPIIVATTFSIAMLLTAFAVSQRKKIAILALVLAVLTIISEVLFFVTRNRIVDIVTNSISILFLAVVILVLVRHALTVRRVTSETVCASLCAFLTMGICWAMIYSLTDLLSPGSFTTRMAYGDRITVHTVYFSFVTLTTLGYGDISPTNAFSRMLAVVEAIVGQLYLVVLVARLVALQISHSGEDKTDPGSD